MGKIFQDPMTTACAIDRVVHHAVILELSGPSFRAEEAKRRSKPEAVCGKLPLFSRALITPGRRP